MHLEEEIYQTMWIHMHTTKSKRRNEHRFGCCPNLMLDSVCLQTSLNTLQTHIMMLFLLELRNGMRSKSFRSLYVGGSYRGASLI